MRFFVYPILMEACFMCIILVYTKIGMSRIFDHKVQSDIISYNVINAKGEMLINWMFVQF